jgi:hypothetical protein
VDLNDFRDFSQLFEVPERITCIFPPASRDLKVLKGVYALNEVFESRHNPPQTALVDAEEGEILQRFGKLSRCSTEAVKREDEGGRL